MFSRIRLAVLSILLAAGSITLAHVGSAETLSLGGTGGAVPANGMDEIDVNGDGRLDLLLHFRTQESGIACGDTSVSITGATLQGQAFRGSDSIVTVGCR